MKEPDRPSVDVMDPVDAMPEPQRSSVIKLKRFIESLRRVRPPSRNGDIFVGAVDRRGIAKVQMFAREGLLEARTIEIECPILHWSYHQFANRLAEEWAEMHKGLFLKTFAPDLYNGDLSPVEITETPTVKSMDLM